MKCLLCDEEVKDITYHILCHNRTSTGSVYIDTTIIDYLTKLQSLIERFERKSV